MSQSAAAVTATTDPIAALIFGGLVICFLAWLAFGIISKRNGRNGQGGRHG
jgi:hypothetical protein